MLYGPGGTGKTMVAKALAPLLDIKNVFNVGSNDFASRWSGEAEKSVGYIFDMVIEHELAYILWSAGPTLCQLISRIIFLG